MYPTLLFIHILVGSASLPLLVFLGWRLFQNATTPRLVRVVFLSNALTVLTGLVLLVAGADITRTCVTLSAYVALSLPLLYLARQQALRLETQTTPTPKRIH